MMPDIAENICIVFTIQQKEDARSTGILFPLLPLPQRLTNHYYKQMHTIRIGTSNELEARGNSCHIGIYHGQDDCMCSSTSLGQTY